jgi:23S rRNA (guanosine2251-2'-O)-methyltransferase
MPTSQTPATCLILHTVRSGYNVGAIFRTAEAAGVKKICLVGYTPAPLDRFGRPNQEITKTALGAEKTLFWEQHSRLTPLLKKLSAAGYQLLALEQAKNAINYRGIRIERPTAIILGNEVSGLPQSILRQCDCVAEIPLRGKKESLNVAVACGIALFHWLADSPPPCFPR